MPAPRTGKRRRSVLFLIVLTGITLITLDSRSGDSGPIGVLGRLAHRIVGPVANIADSIASPVQDWFGGVLDAGSLRKDNEALRRENSRLRIREAQWRTALEENEQLTALAGQPFLDAIPSVAARVVSFAPNNFERTAIIDVGSDEGVAVGMPVVASNGLVGRVLAAWKGGSKVLLLTDAKYAVNVRMVGAEGIDPETAFGSPVRGQLTAEFILPTKGVPEKRENLPIVEGDVVVTSGLNGSEYPPNIPVGILAEVRLGEQQTFIRARIAPYVDLGAIRYVKVLRWEPGTAVPPSLSEYVAPDPSFEGGGAGVPATTTTSLPPVTLPSLGDSGSTTTTTMATNTAGSAG